MCSLFGFLDYQGIMPHRMLRKLTQALANAAEERGTDAAAVDRNGGRVRRGVLCGMGGDCILHELHPPQRFQTLRLVPDCSRNNPHSLVVTPAFVGDFEKYRIVLEIILILFYIFFRKAQ